MTLSISKLTHRLAQLAGLALLIAAMGGSWSRAASAAPSLPPALAAPKAAVSPVHPGDDADEPPAKKGGHKQLSGKLNLNAASEEQLMLLPTVGPAKAERIVSWRKKNGGFKRPADLRRVKGFGYKTFKKLEPYLDVAGETTLVAK
jgi:competence protein ComEA